MFITFNVGVSVGTKANPKTDWINVSANGKQAELLAQYVKKGSKLFLEGFPSVKAYLDKDGKPAASQSLSVNNFELLSSKEQTHKATQHNGYNVEPDYTHAEVKILSLMLQVYR